MIWTIENLSELDNVAQEIVKLFDHNNLFLLYGPMGAGKTTLSAAILKATGSKDTASSPTYSIVNEYLLPNQKKLYHFDLYRLEDPSELEDIGFYEYLDSGNICLIEWPERAEHILLGEKHIKISIALQEGKRIITFEENSYI